MIMRESPACIFSGLDVTGELALYQRHCNDGADAVAKVRHLHMNVDDRICALRLGRPPDTWPAHRRRKSRPCNMTCGVKTKLARWRRICSYWRSVYFALAKRSFHPSRSQ